MLNQDKKRKTGAVLLAGGQGKRMQSRIQKQYMLLNGRPLLTYALEVLERSGVEEIVLVTGAGETNYAEKEIVKRYHFHKVSAVVEGGRERYHSVYEGLKALTDCTEVLIHDGARPLVDLPLVERMIQEVRMYQACAAAVPVKDTIKIADEFGYAIETPDRNQLWQIQTPQAFSYPLIRNAYDALMEDETKQKGITDDAMVIERMTNTRVKLTKGSYRNIKVTTPEDMAVAAAFLSSFMAGEQ